MCGNSSVTCCAHWDLIKARHGIAPDEAQIMLRSSCCYADVWCKCVWLQVAGHALLPAATMLEVTVAASALLHPPSVKGAAPLLTAITLPRALQLASHDCSSEPSQPVRLHMNQPDGIATLVTLGGGALPEQHAVSPGDSIHLTATACRMRQASPAHRAARRAAEQMLSHLVDKQLIHGVVTTQPSASWAAISTGLCEPAIAVPVDCCLHLCAVLQPRSAARSLRVPAGAASYLGSHAHRDIASAHAAAGGPGPLDGAQTVSDHWLVSQAAHGGASTQGLVSKPMTSSETAALTASVLQATANEVQAEGPSQMVYDVIHCVKSPATAEGRMPAQAASFALTGRPQHGQHTHDGLLRGMAASLATAQQAYGPASLLALRTAGAISHDGSIGPHRPASRSQAAGGAAAWSLVRSLEAEADSELQCSGLDVASATARSATSMEMLLGNQSRSDLVRCGMDMRTSVSAGEMTFCYYSCPSISNGDK